MGNTDSSIWYLNDCTSRFAAVHLTFLIPIFGHPVHTNAFILGSRPINTTNNLFGDFILAPWFEQFSTKMSNKEILEIFGGPERPPTEWIPDSTFIRSLYPNCPTTTIFANKDPLRKRNFINPEDCEDSCGDDNEDDGADNGDDGDLVDETSVFPQNLHPTKKPKFFNSNKTSAPILIPHGTALEDDTDPNPLVLPWTVQRIELDTITHPTLRPQLIPENQGGSKPSYSQNSSPHPSHPINTDHTAPTSIPFIKVAILSHGDPHWYDAGSNLWLSRSNAYSFNLADRKYIEKFHDKIFPLRGIAGGKYWEPKPCVFDNKSPFLGVGGDGVKTEKDIFSSHLYPRTSFFRVDSTIGYDFQRLCNIPHLSDVPIKHLATILILDVVSESSLITLYHFIRETLVLLSKGCILPLVDVNLYIITLNAEKVDCRMLGDEEIFHQLAKIGFTHEQIHITPLHPSRYFQRHYSTLIKRPTWKYDIRSLSAVASHNESIKITPPLLSRRNLKLFSAPLWLTIYSHLFHLHNTGYWSRLYSKEGMPKLVPPSQYPTSFYIDMLFGYRRGTLSYAKIKMFEKGLKNVLKNRSDYSDTDILVHINYIVTKAYWQWLRRETYKQFEPIAIGERPLNPNDGNNGEATSTTSPSPLKVLDHYYGDLYGVTPPDWNDVEHYFQHPFLHISNPLPLSFPINFVPKYHNSSIPLPLQYRHHYVQKLSLFHGVQDDMGISPPDPGCDANSIKLGDGQNNMQRNGTCWQRCLPPTLLNPFADSSTVQSVLDHNHFPGAHHDNQRSAGSNKDGASASHCHLDEAFTPIQSLLGLPNQYEFESFILWETEVLVSDTTGFLTLSYFPQPHSTELQRQRHQEASKVLRDERFKRIISTTSNLEAPSIQSNDTISIPIPDNTTNTTSIFSTLTKAYDPTDPMFKGTILDPNSKTRLTSLYYSHTIATTSRSYGDHWSMLWSYRSQLIDLFKRTAAQFGIREMWGPFFIQWWVGFFSRRNQQQHIQSLYEANPPAVPPTILKVHQNAVPLTYCSSRATWDIDNCFPQFGMNPSYSQPSENVHHPLKIKMTYFYHSSSADGNGFPNSPSQSQVNPGDDSEGLVPCQYFSHPLASATSFAPLTWSFGVIVIPFIYVSHRTTRFRELISATKYKKDLKDETGIGFMERFPSQGSSSYPENFTPPPIPGLNDSSYHPLGLSKKKGRDSQLSSLISRGFHSINPNPGGVRSASLCHYSCPITWIVLVLNPVEPDPVPYRELEPCPALKEVLDTAELGTIGHLPNYNPVSQVPQIIKDDDSPILLEPITSSQYRYFTEVLPDLYKKQLINTIFSPHGLNGTEKLNKLWNVSVTQRSQLSEVFQECEKSAIKTRLKLYFDLAAKQHDAGNNKKQSGIGY